MKKRIKEIQLMPFDKRKALILKLKETIPYRYMGVMLKKYPAMDTKEGRQNIRNVIGCKATTPETIAMLETITIK